MVQKKQEINFSTIKFTTLFARKTWKKYTARSVQKYVSDTT